MRILFATDGSKAAGAAAQFLEQLPLPAGSTVDVLAVTAGLEWHVPEWVKATEMEWAQKVLHQACAALTRPDVEVLPTTRAGAPANEILRAAEKLAADLIVVGTRGQGGVPGFFLGSVARNVAKHAGRPVLVAHTPQQLLRQVILAVDGSENASRAVEFAARLPLPQQSEVVVTSVARPYHPYHALAPTEPTYLEQVMEEAREQRRQEAERHVEAAIEPLHAAGRTASAVVREGDPATEIIDLAGERQADLILLGARGVSLIQGLIVGSVADRVLKNAPCSVLLVH